MKTQLTLLTLLLTLFSTQVWSDSLLMILDNVTVYDNNGVKNKDLTQEGREKLLGTDFELKFHSDRKILKLYPLDDKSKGATFICELNKSSFLEAEYGCIKNKYKYSTINIIKTGSYIREVTLSTKTERLLLVYTFSR